MTKAKSAGPAASKAAVAGKRTKEAVAAAAPKARKPTKPKAAVKPKATVKPKPAAEPAPVGLLADLPLQELSRDAASAFLYAALTPEEVLALVRQLGLSTPGFRPEGLGEVERCDLLGDEARADPAARRKVLEVLRHALKEPAFAASGLDAAAAEELLEVAGSDHGLAIALWRLLADPQAAVRARGAAALDRLATEWYGPPPAGEEPGSEGVPPPPAAGRSGPAGGGADTGKVKALQEKVARAEAQAESHRLRGEERAEKLQGQVKEARAEASRAVDEAARARQAAETARSAQVQAEAALQAARSSDAVAEVARLRATLREAEVRLHAAEGRAARAEEQLAVATAEAARHEAAQTAPNGRPAVAAAEQADGEPEDAPATWLLPVFTAEFYDSLAGWDRRIQRAALKQAFLLSQDWRHPSLRALALEGLPGYYRVRVATDVRLIYRRGERQDAVELCSLIDREDLDRYVRQAKTR